MARTYQLPASYEAAISAALEPLGYSLREPKRLAEAVLRLSDHYTQNPLAATPWAAPWAQAASLVYYFPLNLARCSAVATEAKRLGFFEGLEGLVDFGSGTGSAIHAFTDIRGFKALDAIDVSKEALELAKQLKPSSTHRLIATTLEKTSMPKALGDLSRTLLVASYSLTELTSLPGWWREAEALAIIEPSTQEDSRKLMGIRKDLIETGHSIWGPCTHQGACPLLEMSARDFCHDRIHWQAPAWFLEMEKHLPMKNRTLTFSYLLARKTKAAPKALGGLARLTGDTLEEKGKHRQSVCRGPEREFLAWFPQRLKKDESITLDRGSLVRLGTSLSKKATEVRLSAPDSIEELDSESEISD